MSYYEILGLGPGASLSEIKAAYRRLAKEFHPDSGHPGDVERFRQVKLAYETLSDAERRRAYDAGGSGALLGVEPVAPVSWTGGFEEPLPPFREVFAGFRAPAPIHLDMVLTEAEARRGADVFLEVAEDVDCPRCNGRGFGFFGWCESCRGHGIRRVRDRVHFRVPGGAASGDVVTGTRANGLPVRAMVRVVGS